jgi:Protein of unknown function (DUF3616)
MMGSMAIKLLVGEEFKHFGRCDSSGSLALGDQHFLVADDEQNVISIYRSDTDGQAVQIFDINHYFAPYDGKEVDIEGSAALDEVVFWITSHGTNSKGAARPKRQQFFATKLVDLASGHLEQVGHSYTKLVADLIADDRLQKYDFESASQIAPKKTGGLNIEALAATPQQELLIGFRNPLIAGRAIVLKLKNPRELVLDPLARAEFGKPIELELGGLGIRSMEYWPELQQYLIVAGAVDGGNTFALYWWDGDRSIPPQLVDVLLPADFRPEGIVLYPQPLTSAPAEYRLQLISDDGAVVRDGQTACKDLLNSEQKYFRSLWLTVSDAGLDDHH